MKVIIDFYNKKVKNKSVISFYSDRSAPRGQASSGGFTDFADNVSQNAENANKFRYSVRPLEAKIQAWKLKTSTLQLREFSMPQLLK